VVGDVAEVVEVIASVVGAVADVDEEVIGTDRIYASSMVVAVKLLKLTVNVKPPIMAAKLGIMTILFMWEAVRTPLPGAPLSTKASRQSTLGYSHGSSLSVDSAQATNLMVTQDTDKVFIQVRSPCGRNTYVLRLIVLLWIVLS